MTTTEKYLKAMQEMKKADSFVTYQIAKKHQISMGVCTQLKIMGHIAKDGHRSKWVGGKPTMELARKVQRMLNDKQLERNSKKYLKKQEQETVPQVKIYNEFTEEACIEFLKNVKNDNFYYEIYKVELRRDRC